jgi:hypothetical protein
VHPVVIVHEWNSIAHLQSYEGDPEARPFTREELQRFIDYADDQVARAVRAKRKGVLAAYRDATLLRRAPRVGGWRRRVLRRRQRSDRALQQVDVESRESRQDWFEECSRPVER